MEETGMDVAADNDTMLYHIEEARKVGARRDEDDSWTEELPWSTEEELFITKAQMTESKAPVGRFRTLFRGVAFIAAVCAMTVFLMQMLSAAKQAASLLPEAKFHV